MPPEKNSNSRTGITLVQSYSLTDKEFEEIRILVKAQTGISLGLHKRDLVVSRLSRRLRTLGMGSFAEYIELLRSEQGGDELVNMVNQITTNKTDFFREAHHFKFLSEKLLPQIFAQGEASGERRLRIWSAGCSSGEEPYTLGITLMEFFKDKPGWDIKVLATDIDTSILTKASQGIYDARQLEPVPEGLTPKYFDEVRGEGISRYQVKPALRKLFSFRKFNLMTPEYPLKVQMDFIFCRNVLIYFDNTDKASICSKFHRVLKPHGHLFVGHSESLMMVKHLFHYVATTVYQKV